MGGWNVIMIGFGAAIFIALSYISVPKGPNQTWAITYLAQLHPLITPKSTGGIHEELMFGTH
ncbi:12929_t:CDS:2 [Cetraspora pellucida]|uniref:12929_t:CDS:1 n=1 Tax=Cetraspora pellucida TaxID=1433469 RepID=A0A9N8ZHP5_9GLOM|nr:12929_t:CDS:2 [Cetraspora pellucida]